MEIQRTIEEIDKVLDEAGSCICNGTSLRADLTFEQGLMAFADWIFGHTDKNPFDSYND